MKRLENKVVIVTGAGRGIGFATVELFSKEGAIVIATDIFEHKLKDIITLKLDVTKKEDWENVVKKVISEYGRIDVLVNNVGVNSHKDLLAEDIEDWNNIILINCTSMMIGMKEVIPYMIKQGGGSIINCSSILGLIGGDSSSIAYSASKGAIRSMSRQVAQQFSKDNIRVNSVYPGIIIPSSIVKSERLISRNKMPLPPHVGEPIDVAYGYLYLASDESKFVTGSELVIDGGWFAK